MQPEQTADLHEIKSPTDMSIGVQNNSLPKTAPIVQPVATTPAVPTHATQTAEPRTLMSGVESMLPESEKRTNEYGGTENVSLMGNLVHDHPILDPDAQFVSVLAQNSSDPKTVLDSYESAKALTAAFPGASAMQIMGNMDDYLSAYYGNNKPEKTNAKAIWDATHAGALMVELGMKGSDAMMSAWTGQSAEKDKEIIDITKRIAELSIDNTPRSWYVDALKILGNLAPYTAYFMGTTAAASAIGEGVGGVVAAAGLTKTALVLAQAVKMINATQSAAVMAGTDYSNMIANGIDSKTASRIAPVTGVINSLIEQYSGFGLEAGIQTVMAKKAQATLASTLAARMIASGATTSIAKKVMGFAAGQVVGETIEEESQNFVSGVGELIAEGMAENPAAINSKGDMRTLASDMASQFSTIVWTSAILGIPATAAMHFKTVNDAQIVKGFASVTTKEQFAEVAPEMEQFANVPEEQRADVASQVWEAQQAEDSVSKEEKIANARDNRGEDQAPVVRTKTGALDITETGSTSMDDKTVTTYTAQNPKTGERYGEVTVAVGDQDVTIMDGNFSDKHEGLSDEMVHEIAARFPTKKLIMDQAQADFSLSAAYEKAVKDNPNGQEAGAQWSSVNDSPADSAAKTRLRMAIPGEDFASPAEREAVISLISAFAGNNAGDFAKFTETLNIKSDERLSGMGKAGALTKQLSTSDYVKQTKYVISLAKEANTATLVHEVVHFAKETSLGTESLNSIEELYGVKNHEWTTEQEERLVNETMALISGGKITDEKARPFLARIADYLKNLWNKTLSKIDIKPEIEKALNNWFSNQGKERKYDQAESLDLKSVKDAEPEIDTSQDMSDNDMGGLKSTSVSSDQVPVLVKTEGLKLLSNFKRGANPDTGVTEEGRITEKYNPVGANPVQVWEKIDGSHLITSGRHRLDAARRSGEDSILAYVFKESDGYTQSKMIMMDIISNIQDDKGTAQDYAKVVKEGALNYGQLETAGFLGTAKGRQGAIIGKFASDLLYARFMEEHPSPKNRISAEIAATIADIGRNDEGLQQLGIENKNLPREELAQLLHWAKDDFAARKAAAGQGTFEDIFAQESGPVQGEMFGNSFDAQVAMQKKLIATAEDLKSDFIANVNRRKTALSMSKEKTQEILKGEAETIIEDPALVRSSISVYEDRIARMEKGGWRNDPELAARVYEKAGIPLTEEMKNTLEIANLQAEMAGAPVEDFGQNALFMSAEEIKRGNENAKDRMSREMKDFNTVDEWLQAVYPGMEYPSEKALKELTDFFNYAKEHGFKPASEEVPGKFSDTLKTRDQIMEFLDKIHGAMQSSQDPATRNRAKQVREAISHTVVIRRAVDRLLAGKTLTDADLVDIRQFVKSNEGPVRFLAARLEGNVNKAYDAMLSMKRVPDILKRPVLSKPGVSMAEQKEIIDYLSSDTLREKVKDKSFTLKDLDEYTRMNLNTREQKAREKGAEYRDYKEFIKERDAAKRLSVAIKKLKRFIMNPTSASINAEEGRMIDFIQQYLKNPTKDPEAMARDIEALSSVVFQSDPSLVSSLISDLESISKKPFEEMSYGELDAIAEIVDLLTKRGRAANSAKRMAFNMVRDRYIKQLQAAIDKAGKFTVTGSVDDDEQKKSHRIRNLLGLPTMRMDLIASYILDNKNRKGLNTQLLFDQMITHQREKLKYVRERTGEVKNWIAAQKINDHIHREIVVPGLAGPDGTAVRMTADNLLGSYLLVGKKENFNVKQREAFIFGHLFSQAERDVLGNDGLRAIMEERANSLIESVEGKDGQPGLLTRDELILGDKMMESLNKYSDWERIAKEYMKVSNIDMGHERFYFPIKRTGPMSEGEDLIADAFSKAWENKAIDKSFVLDRSQNIQPVNQRDIDVSASRLFFDSISHQEHLAAFGGYLKMLQGIYGGHTKESLNLVQQLKSAYGEGVIKSINNHMEQIASPGDFTKKDPSEGMFSFWRGSMAISNLAFRYTSVAMQLMTSPMPFLTEVNAFDLAKVAGEAIASNPLEWYQTIERRSPILASRQLETMVELMRMKNTGFDGACKRFGQIGMKGLEFADRFSVAMGWEAIRRDQRAKGKTEAEAVDYADKFVIKTQPTSEDLYRSSMYQNMTFFKRCFLQFTQPMSVIYQNLKYDVPMYVKEGENMKAFGMLAAYAFSGLAMGVTGILRGKGPEDEDRVMQYWIQQMTSQYVSAVPIVGDSLNNFVRATVMGEQYRAYGDDYLPIGTDMVANMDAIRQAILAESDEDRQKHIWAAGEFAAQGLGTMLGLPVLAAKNAVKTGIGLQKSAAEW